MMVDVMIDEKLEKCGSALLGRYNNQAVENIVS
jgi:hypothetical protein